MNKNIDKKKDIEPSLEKEKKKSKPTQKKNEKISKKESVSKANLKNDHEKKVKDNSLNSKKISVEKSVENSKNSEVLTEKENTKVKFEYNIKNIALAKNGSNLVRWSEFQMPVIKTISDFFFDQNIFKGLKIAACLHITAETAILLKILKENGAEVYLCSANPHSINDDVAAYIASNIKIPIFAKKGESIKEFESNIEKVLKYRPNFILDDSAQLITYLYRKKYKYIDEIFGATEETISGIEKLKNMYNKNVLSFPIIAVDTAITKILFDNKIGTGQSVLDGILRATNIILSGRKILICGYGNCGKGIAEKAKGLGMHVLITEVNPIKAMQAVLDGFTVKTFKEACKEADIICTVTGNINIIKEEDIDKLKDGALICNAGLSDIEIDVNLFEKIAIKKERIKEHITIYTLFSGKKISIISDGKLINLSASDGHPAAVMDLSFSTQFYAIKYLKESHEKRVGIFRIPFLIDEKIAELKLMNMGYEVDSLTKEQEEFVSNWNT